MSSKIGKQGKLHPMDFFDGLDNGRYAEFNKSILNGMTAGFGYPTCNSQ
jgi:hypothetical protein